MEAVEMNTTAAAVIDSSAADAEAKLRAAMGKLTDELCNRLKVRGCRMSIGVRNGIEEAPQIAGDLWRKYRANGETEITIKVERTRPPQDW